MHLSSIIVCLVFAGLSSSRPCTPRTPGWSAGAPADLKYMLIPGLPLCNPGEQPTAAEGSGGSFSFAAVSTSSDTGDSTGSQNSVVKNVSSTSTDSNPPSEGNPSQRLPVDDSSSSTSNSSSSEPEGNPSQSLPVDDSSASSSNSSSSSETSAAMPPPNQSPPAYSPTPEPTPTPSPSTPPSSPPPSASGSSSGSGSGSGSSSSSNGGGDKSSPPPSGNYPSYKSSITMYGAGDCASRVSACGWLPSSGFTAAASQALYGIMEEGHPGSHCGTCWRITGTENSAGGPITTTPIVVIINNECPAEGNSLCSQPTLSDTNQVGANVNIDLCTDSGAVQAFFGTTSESMAMGTATQVDCSEWSGTNGTSSATS